MADEIFRLMSELGPIGLGSAEFTQRLEIENPANLRLTFKITAEIQLKCNSDYNTLTEFSSEF